MIPLLRWRPIGNLDDIQARRAKNGTTFLGIGPPPTRKDLPPPPRKTPGSEAACCPTCGVDLELAAEENPSFARLLADARTQPINPDGSETPRRAATPAGRRQAPTELDIPLAFRVRQPEASQIMLRTPAPQTLAPTLDKEPESMAKYLSKAWVDEGKQRALRDETLKTRALGLNGSILCVVHDTPEHADEVFYISFDDGRLDELHTGTLEGFRADGRDATFEVHGDYATYSLIQEGHLSHTTAIMRGKLKLKGSLLKARRYIHVFDELSRVLRDVPTEF